jgi:large subunit ribosomal protein L31
VHPARATRCPPETRRHLEARDPPCGASFTTRSTLNEGTIRAEVCSECHPFYTGKQKILDTGGRVARFEARFGKAAAKK